MEFKLIAQEDSMGCAIACVAGLLGISYEDALKIFGLGEAPSCGIYCRNITSKLKNKGLNYSYGKVINKTKKYLNVSGTIVFIRRSEEYPYGHYLLRTEEGWMDPWINTPKINPAKAGIRKDLPGEAQWIIYKKE